MPLRVEKRKRKIMAKEKKSKGNTADNKELERARLTAQLEDTQRRLYDGTDELAKCERKINDSREELAAGFDHRHFKWLVPAVLLFIGAAALAAIEYKTLAIFCVVMGVIIFVRWFSDLFNFWRKYKRAANRLKHNVKKSEELAEKNSQLRMRLLELRQKLEQLDR